MLKKWCVVKLYIILMLTTGPTDDCHCAITIVSNFFMIETIICSHNSFMSREIIDMVEPVCFTTGQCQVQYKHTHKV